MRTRPLAMMAWLAATAVLCGASPARARTFEVGPGKAFGRIEDAAARARPGDVVLIHPLPGGRPYLKVAVFVRQKNVTFRGVPGKDGRRVPLSGKGYAYSGRGRIPRALFQFNRGADGCTLENVELFGAHNRSHNGAGVRINQANDVTIRNCEIRRNDMGIMSNGDGTQKTARNQLIEHCVIHHNGDPKRPGYNHNLYLGGTSAVLRFSEVHSSLTGHNVKSRAHHTRVECCTVRDSANREFDLVDARDTTAPGSHAVLIGNIIVKDPRCRGNRAVIHFGQDGGGPHDGTLHLIHNTIVTPFISPVLDLSAAKARAVLIGNIVTSGGRGQRNQVLIAATRGGAKRTSVSGSHNWFGAGFRRSIGGTRLDAGATTFGKRGAPSPFADAKRRDFRLAPSAKGIIDAGLPAGKLAVPVVPGAPADEGGPLRWQYKHPAGKEPRPSDGKPDLGAHEFVKESSKD